MGVVRADDVAFVSGFLAATGFFAGVGGGLWLIFCVRRVARLRIRLIGVPASGEVIGMVVQGAPTGAVLNSPQVRYFAKDGPPVVTSAMGYRAQQVFVTGAQVSLWYDPLRPEVILVAGFDVRLRDFLALAASSFVTAVGVVLEVAAYLIG